MPFVIFELFFNSGQYFRLLIDLINYAILQNLAL